MPHPNLNELPGESGESSQPGEKHDPSKPHEAERPMRASARGTAAMDPGTRQEVARKGGLAVSRNKAHMADIGRKGGQSVSRNREHMAEIGRKGGAASRGSRGGPSSEAPASPSEEPKPGSGS